MIEQKHIALLYTGGTVGMERSVHGYAPMRDFAGVLAGRLDAGADRLPRYTLHAYPDPIDSANATLADWQRIARDIADRYADYDGFVVLHGTDTMAYTAAGLSFMLQGLRKPVILTGAQVPLCEPGSDAEANVVGALRLAAAGRLQEVAIFFGGRLLRGNRATKLSAFDFAAFDSPNYPMLAKIGTGIRWNSAALLRPADSESFEIRDYRADILSFRFTPGLNLRVLQALLDLQPQAVILQCYGSGTVPDRDPALLTILASASQSGIIVAACSQVLQGSVAIGTYAAGAGLGAAGVIGAADMCFEAVFAKLHHLFARGLSAAEVRAALPRNLCGELSDSPPEQGISG